MMLSALAGAVLATAVQVARPQEVKKEQLTVDEALTVLTGLTQLSGPQEPDKDGKSTYFQLSADVRILIANNVDIGRRATAVSQAAINDMKLSMMDKDQVFPKDKQEFFLIQVAKIGQAKSNVAYYHLSLADLCLRVSEKCKVANNIPASILSMLWPIIDDKP